MAVIKKTSFILSLLTALMISAVALTGCSSTSNTETEPVTINLAAAASLTDVMEEVNALYMQQNPHVTIVPSYASSGTLQQQIEQGAPVDIFMSAGASQMNTLQNKQLIVNDSRRDLLNNTIVLVVPDESTLGIHSFDDLLGDGVSTIAIGDPEFVPAGRYGKQALEFYDMYSQVQSKLVLCSDVRQVLTYVESGNVDVGIVYATDAMISDTVHVVAKGPDEVNSTIVYPVALIKDCENPDAAEEFEDFLFSDEAGEIFEEYGFTLVGN
ncbi:MAG: molybdate ABC transporter substrate-binding protein [Dehalococcoidia bacterium]